MLVTWMELVDGASLSRGRGVERFSLVTTFNFPEGSRCCAPSKIVTTLESREVQRKLQVAKNIESDTSHLKL